MPFVSRRKMLKQLTIEQLELIAREWNIDINNYHNKTGLISRLMSLPKETLEEEVWIAIHEKN